MAPEGHPVPSPCRSFWRLVVGSPSWPTKSFQLFRGGSEDRVLGQFAGFMGREGGNDPKLFLVPRFPFVRDPEGFIPNSLVLLPNPLTQRVSETQRNFSRWVAQNEPIGGANRRFWCPCFHLPGQPILEFRLFERPDHGASPHPGPGPRKFSHVWGIDWNSPSETGDLRMRFWRGFNATN